MTQTLDRSGLAQLGAQYLCALTARQPARLPLWASVRYTENGQDIDIGDGLWASCDSDEATHPITICDVARQEMIQIARIMESEDRALIGTRLKWNGDTISEIETVVARQEGGFLSPPPNWPYRPELNAPLPRDARVPRAEMLSSANGYFVGLEQASDQFTRFHRDAHRIENGNIMTNNPDHDVPTLRLGPKEQFATGFSKILKSLRERRYICDEETGVVCAMLFFDHLIVHENRRMVDGEPVKMRPPFNRPFSFQTFEAFKVWGGELREIEAVIAACPYMMKSGWADETL